MDGDVQELWAKAALKQVPFLERAYMFGMISGLNVSARSVSTRKKTTLYFGFFGSEPEQPEKNRQTHKKRKKDEHCFMLLVWLKLKKKQLLNMLTSSKEVLAPLVINGADQQV